jgi:hypothetical protein
MGRLTGIFNGDLADDGQSISIRTAARRCLMVGWGAFASYRALISWGDDELGRGQHDISARHAGYHTVFLILLPP